MPLKVQTEYFVDFGEDLSLIWLHCVDKISVEPDKLFWSGSTLFSKQGYPFESVMKTVPL